jgi:hypothetical protein
LYLIDALRKLIFRSDKKNAVRADGIPYDALVQMWLLLFASRGKVSRPSRIWLAKFPKGTLFGSLH